MAHGRACVQKQFIPKGREMEGCCFPLSTLWLFFFFFKDFETSGGGKEWGETCKSWSPCSLVSWNISAS